MKPHQDTIPHAAKTTVTDIVRWAQELTRLHMRIATQFARPEPRRRALAFLKGILSEVSRKNGWQLAEQAGEATPYGMQRLLSQAVWDADGVRNDLRTYVLEHLGDPQAVLATDETSFPKRGKKSAGVQVQYCGSTGEVENCQVAVFLSYVTDRGHALIDRELSLPKQWTDDPERCREAGIPESIRFQTKCELAQQMVERVHQAGIPMAWVVADTVYGSNVDRRTWLEAHKYQYVLAVACDEPVGIQTPQGRRWVEVRDVEAFLLHDQDWQGLSMSEGTKGPRLFDWACVPILYQWGNDGKHWLLIRRDQADSTRKTYYFVFAQPGATLQEMVKAIGKRWPVEEDFEINKDMGLGDYQVRSFLGWYRHITLVMLAYAFLVVICAKEPCENKMSNFLQQQASHPPIEKGGSSLKLASKDKHSASNPAASLLVPQPASLTVPEVRHLLARLIWPPPSSVTPARAWSWWRRCHRGMASYYHTKRRLQAG
jgi:SRSO17 transposase